MFGGKADNLIWLRQNFTSNVPNFFVVDPNKSLDQQWKECQKKFPRDTKVAFRSSATVEDGKQYSFAGMFDSFLDIKLNKSNFQTYVKKCISALNNPRLIEYAHNLDINLKSVKIFVIVQKMFTSQFSGVSFVNKKQIMLAYDKGSTQVVHGSQAKEMVVVANNNFKLNHKYLPPKSDIKVWQALVKSLQKINKLTKTPQDVEWAINGQDFVLLQMRPITKSLHNYRETITWDATNIGENYPGVTYPLTFTFICKAYSNVYPAFFKLMGIDQKVLDNNQGVFTNLIGYINGHVYYNINTWYEMLKLLPFYKSNKEFFETMLTPAKKKKSKKTQSSFSPDYKSMLFFAYRMIWPHHLFKKFERETEKLMNSVSQYDPNDLSSFEIAAQYQKLSKNFFDLWGYTIVNDFRVMISYGILNRLAQKWLKNPQNFLRTSASISQTPYSLEPLQELQKIANLIHKNPKLKKLFTQDVYAIQNNLDSLGSKNKLQQALDNFLSKYGSRRGNELKLEEPSWNENPHELLTLLKQYLNQETYFDNLKSRPKSVSPKPDFQDEKINFFKKLVLKKWLNFTLRNIYRREKYRLIRGQVFNLSRQIFLTLGQRLVDNQMLQNKNDIFFLHLPEIWNLIRFHNLPVTDLKILVKKRKKQLDQFSKVDLPVRLITSGFNFKNINFQPDLPNQEKESKNLKGVCTSLAPSITGEIVVMHKFDPSIDVFNKILVTVKTDPGWTVLFPLVKGLVIEKGNALSHASIIARELKKPCLVNVTGATKLLQSGQTVRLNTDLESVEVVKSK